MSTTEKHQFQAEIQQLLNIVIHSLYTDKEIFIRELISNAADACEKLRFLQSSGQAIYQPDAPLAITIEADEKAGTITITDAGIGMSQAELVENLGTIAHSGTKAFLQQIATEKKADAKLIGQFGVGFYSAFMAAMHVTVYTRSHRPEETGWKWSSDGAGGYEIEPGGDLPRGSKIVLDLKDEAKNFTKDYELTQVIKKYSNFVQFPISLNGTLINTVSALWTRNKNEIKPEEYTEFYKYIGHDHDEPLMRLHFNADAPIAIQSLLFIPKHNLETNGMAHLETEVSLYCRKVLIQSRCRELLPEWFRFVKGVVDSEDLPLNISRETMQDSALVQKLNKVLTGRLLKFLDETATNDTDTYLKFYQEFNRFIKEGVTNDYAHRDALAKLLRYESSTLEAGKLCSLAEYVQRMTGDQKEIYLLMAPNREAALASPYYEGFKSRNYEVLFMYDPWDEFVVEHLANFDGKRLVLAEKAQIEVAEKPANALSDDDAKALATWMKETLGDRVSEVKISQRLVDSPAVVVDSDHELTSNMKRLLKQMNRDKGLPDMMKQNLEINPAHGIVTGLNALRVKDPALAQSVTEQVLDNARVAAGLLDDPRAMLARMNTLLERLLKT